MEDGYVFTRWSDEVESYLRAQLARTDFKITRSDSTPDAHAVAAATVLDGAALVEGYPLTGDQVIRAEAQEIIAYVRQWTQETIDILEQAQEQFAETFSDFSLEIFPYEDFETKRLRTLLIGGELRATPKPDAVALSSVEFYAGIQKVSPKRFSFAYVSPDALTRRVRQFALWERRRSLIDGVLEGRVSLLTGQYLDPNLDSLSEIDILAQASPQQRYNHFFVHTAGQGFWMLHHPEQGFWRTQQTPTESVGVWSMEALAYLYADALGLEEHTAEYVFWESWESLLLPEWRRWGVQVEVNPMPNNPGACVSIETFVRDAATARESVALGLLPKLSIPGDWVAVLEL